jgi:TPR repeat protein
MEPLNIASIIQHTHYLTDLKELDESYYDIHKKINAILQASKGMDKQANIASPGKRSSPNTMDISGQAIQWDSKHNIASELLNRILEFKNNSEVNIVIAKAYYICLEDHAKYVEHLELSGTPHSLYLLGEFYFDKDEVKAKELFEKSAGPIFKKLRSVIYNYRKKNGGDMYAQYKMAQFKEEECNREKSDDMTSYEKMYCQLYAEQTTEYYKYCAYQGHYIAQYIYSRKTCGKERIELLRKSAMQGHKKAFELLKHELYNTDEYKRRVALSKETHKIDQELNTVSIQYYVNRLEQDPFDLECAQRLSKLYYSPHESNENQKSRIAIYKTLFKKYEDLIKTNDPMIIYVLMILYKGYNFYSNKDKIRRLLEKAAGLGCHRSQYLLGVTITEEQYKYFNAPGDNNLFLKGIELLKQSASQGNLNAIYRLAVISRDGIEYKEISVKKDPAKAMILFMQCRDNVIDKKIRCDAVKYIVEMKLSKMTDVHQMLCYCVQYNCDYKIPEILIKNTKYLSYMCKYIYKHKRLDRTDTIMLSYLYRKIKNVVENNVPFPVSQNNNGLRPFVQAYDGCIKDRVTQMRDNLDKTPLYVTTLHDIIDSYMNRYYL